VAGREILQIDHSRAGTRMRVIVWCEPEGDRPGREESLIFESYGSDWSLVRRSAAPARSLGEVLDVFRDD